MIVLVEAQESRAVRNKDNVLALCKLMINEKKSGEATARYLTPDRARVVVHKIIAVGDYVFADVNFLNLLTRSASTVRRLVDEVPQALTSAVPGRGEALLVGIDLRGRGFQPTEHAGSAHAMHVVPTKRRQRAFRRH